MRLLFRLVSIALVAAAMLSIVGGATVGAAATCTNNADPLACACSAGANDSSACDPSTSSNDSPISGSGGVIQKASLVIAIIAGIAAVIIIIIAGLQYITSAGDPQKAASARNAIIGSVVGLVIIAAAEGIITFVISKI